MDIRRVIRRRIAVDCELPIAIQGIPVFPSELRARIPAAARVERLRVNRLQEHVSQRYCKRCSHSSRVTESYFTLTLVRTRNVWLESVRFLPLKRRLLACLPDEPQPAGRVFG